MEEKTQFAKMLSEIGEPHIFPSETNFLAVKEPRVHIKLG
jgi:histidinol-phosphate/aromatic aminotransferase/cobyric acid decarboxylase-like protein